MSDPVIVFEVDAKRHEARPTNPAKRRLHSLRQLSRRRPASSGFLADVEHLAETVADTVNRLDARGLHHLSQPLLAALERLGRSNRR